MSLTPAREMAVLSVVLAHPAHGYDIAAGFETGPLALLGLKKSAVYSILARFVKRGWVEERVEDAGVYPDRLMCYPLEAGRAALPDLIEKAAALPQTPLMALMMLADTGFDVRGAARLALKARQKARAALEADPHAGGASGRLAKGVLDAEIAALEALL